MATSPTPSTTVSRLTMIGRQLVAAARSNPGEIQRRKLAGGAQLAAVSNYGVLFLTILRFDAPVGDVEERTFRRDLPIPVEAKRKPEAGQQHHKVDEGEAWVVGYVWADNETGREG